MLDSEQEPQCYVDNYEIIKLPVNCGMNIIWRTEDVLSVSHVSMESRPQPDEIRQFMPETFQLPLVNSE